ncbi:hypothetical protein HCH52_03320 [Oscillospiraceae bacterium HV4-5-C5C]|nr:hypothetical protein [Oscillospiraceae bacterium HV4-5-C5C]
MIGIFPNPESYVRLITIYLMEYAEDWSASKAYLSQKSIEDIPTLATAWIHSERNPKLRTSVDTTNGFL